jgi:hypothetical protein
VLDHHASARPVVEAFGDRGIFADEVSQPGVSGATLAFEHVWRKIVTHPDTWPATIEDFAQLVGVRDTWQTQHPQWWRACDLQAVLLGLPRDYWMMNRDRIPDAVSPRLLELGEAFRAQHARKVQGVVEGGTFAVVDGAGLHAAGVGPAERARHRARRDRLGGAVSASRIVAPRDPGPRPTEIHAEPCEHCPSAHHPPDPEALDMRAWPRHLQVAAAFPCAWRPTKLCKGYCDSIGMTDADAESRRPQ